MSSRARAFSPEILRCRLDPDLPGVEARLAVYRREAFARHIHDAFSVGAVLSGETRMWRHGVCGSVAAGSVVCIAPGEPHACNPVPDGRLGYIMFSLGGEAAGLVAGGIGAPAFVRPLAHDPGLARRLAGFFRLLGGPGPRLEKEIRFHGLFAPLFCPATAAPRRDPQAVRRIRDHLQAHLRQNVSLVELAALVGRSPAHVLRLFRREAGLPPHAYQNFLRVDQAKRLIAAGLPAAQVAQEVGFADQSHLIRAFTPQVGATPRQYRLSLAR